jgi:hypothetical protein
MSLCVAWIREAGGSQELVFVTDSTLTSGEKWNHGIKLFEIPNTNCLLSFVGGTQRAYTLVLNLMSSISFDDILNSQTTIEDILEHIVELFTILILEIKLDVGYHSSHPKEDLNKLRNEAKFLFGGWDWESEAFRLWKIYYSIETEEMLYEELVAKGGTRNFVEYIGDAHTPYNIEERAKEKFLELLECQGSTFDCALNMEPAEIIRDIALDSMVREIGGSLQIAKLQKSNKVDFFGIYWPSADGEPHFQGRKYNTINKPNVQYYNSDTFEILEMDVPNSLHGIDEKDYSTHMDFLHSCYPDGELKERLSEKDRNKLKILFRDVAYQKFLEECDSNTVEKEEVHA